MASASPVKIPHAEPSVASGASRWSTVAAAAGYLGVALLLYWPLPLRLSTHIAGDPFGDPLLNAWTLGWGADRLAHGLRGLWNAPIFHPFPDTLAWSEHLLGIAVFVAPGYWLTHNIVLQYNVAFLGSAVLAGLGMYLLAYDVTGRRSAAWLAGLLFACLPYRVAHVTHLQVLMSGWMPLALLGLHRYLRTGSRRALAGFAAAFLLTALSNGYYLFFLAVPAAVVTMWQLAERWRRRESLSSALAGLALATVVVIVTLSPVIAAYTRVTEMHGFTRTREEMVKLSGKPRHYLRASAGTTRWGGVIGVGRPELALYPGATLTLLALIGLVGCRRYPRAWPYAVIAPVAVLLSFGPEPDVGFASFARGPYDLLLALPGANGLRVPARFAMIVYLAMCVLAAAGVAWLGRRMPGRWLWATTAVLTVVTIAEGRPAVPLVATTRALSLLDSPYQWLATQPGGAVLELPAGNTRETVKYMAGTLIHRHPIVNGYSGHGSALQDLLAGPPSLEPSQADALLEAAAGVGVRYVLVHEYLYGDRTFGARLAHALSAASSSIVRSSRNLDSTTVVAIDAPAARTPALIDPALSLKGCAVTASHSADTAGRALDGDRETRWVSGPPQDGSEWLTITCLEPRILTGLDVTVSRRSFANCPRRLVIERSTDGTAFHLVFEGSILPSLAQDLAIDARQPYARLPLPPGEFRVLRLRQVARAERPSFWAIDDLIVRGH